MNRITAIEINKKDFDILGAFVENGGLYEMCALLLGVFSRKIAVVKEAYLVENAERSRVLFSIAPESLYKAYVYAENLGIEVVGIFHSHPAETSPSSLDLEFMKVNPIVWLIMSSLDKSFGAYQFLDGNVNKVNVLVKN